MTLERAKAITRQLEGLADTPIFIDSRDTQRAFDADDVKEVASYLHQTIMNKKIKIAILDPNHFAYAKMFEKCLISVGFKNVAVFLEYEKAMLWIHPELDMTIEKLKH